MHILLINSNPVISRLLVLCTRDDTLFLEEVSSMEEVKRDSYNVVFVDEASYGEGVKDFLEEMTETLKVFISFDALPVSGFDESIKKPFLPSEIKALIKRAQEEKTEREEEIGDDQPFIFPLSREEVISEEIPEDSVLEENRDKVPEEDIEKSLVEEATHLLEISEAEEKADEQGQEVENSAEEEHFIEKILEEAALEEVASKEESSAEDKDEQDEAPEEEIVENQPLTVLNADEVEKIKALLEMDDTLEVEEELSEEALEARKIEVIKEQLIADGLEIVEENTMIESLSIQLDGSFEKDQSKKYQNKKDKKKKKKSKKLKFTEENMEHIEDAVEMAMASMTKKQMKKLLKGKEISINIKLEGKD